MTIGQKLTALRKANGYSRIAFAEKLGLPQTTLRNYETDVREPGHSFLIKIAQEFSVSVDFLLGLTDSTIPFYKNKELSSSSDLRLTDIIKIYNDINEEGREKLADYASDLEGNPRYKKESQLDMDSKEA